MSRAFRGGRVDVLINSRELHQSLGGYPGSVHGMPQCCDAMQNEIKPGDTLVVETPAVPASACDIVCRATDATFQTCEITV